MDPHMSALLYTKFRRQQSKCEPKDCAAALLLTFDIGRTAKAIILAEGTQVID